MNKLFSKSKGVSALILLTLVWGMMPPITRYLSHSMSVYQQLYLRFAIGFVLILLLFKKQISFKRMFSMTAKEWLLIIARSFFYYFIGAVLYNKALLLTKIGNVSFVAAFPMTAIMGFILLKEKFSWQKLTWVVVAFLGVVLVSAGTQFSLDSIGLGEVLAFISIFFISIGLISRNWQTKKINDLETATIMLFFSFLFVMLFSLFKGEKFEAETWGLGVILVLLIGGLFNSLISYLMNYGMKRVEAVLANNIIALESVFAPLIAFFLLGEVLKPTEIIGGIIIVISAVLMNTTTKSK